MYSTVFFFLRLVSIKKVIVGNECIEVSSLDSITIINSNINSLHIEIYIGK